jgi:hypothetical protein
MRSDLVEGTTNSIRSEVSSTMSNLNERNRHLVVLAPSSDIPSSFQNVEADPAAHRVYLEALQRMRGRIYLDDGAISIGALDESGRHIHVADPLSLHLLSIGSQGEARSCARFLPCRAGVQFSELMLSRASVCRDSVWGHRLRQSFEQTAQKSAENGFLLAEVGGWAVSEHLRGTGEALRLVLFMYALGALYGRTIAICTATKRHGSSEILKRIGARPVQWNGNDFPPYFDRAYGCSMEVLMLDSAHLNRKYATRFTESSSILQVAPVICSHSTPGVDSLVNLAEVLRSDARTPKDYDLAGLRVSSSRVG